MIRRLFPWMVACAVVPLVSIETHGAAPKPPLRKNRWDLRARAGFNIRADIVDSSVVSSSVPAPPAAGGGVDRQYDNGYVKIPSATAPLGTTWNWGYASDTQYDPAGLGGQGSIAMSAVTSLDQQQVRGVQQDPHAGIELSYGKDLGYLGQAIWGFEFAFGTAFIEINDRSTLSGQGSAITDLFGLGGAIPPGGGYAGTFDGPGTLLDDFPSTRTTATGATISSGLRKLNSTVYGLRGGPSLYYPGNEHWTFGVSGGPALILVDSELKFNEAISVAGGTPISRSGRRSDLDLVLGAYVEGKIEYHFKDPRWSLFGGLMFLHVPNSSVDAGVKRATLRMGRSVWAEFGIGYSY